MTEAAPFWKRRLDEARAHVRQDGRDPALDGVRGIAVALVFLVHIHRVVGPLAPDDADLQFALHSVSVTGQVGVLLFFVLSGFLIYGLAIERRPPYGAFLWRRLQRIYPTYLAVVAVHLAACLAFPDVSKLPEGAGAAAEYVVRELVLLPGLGATPSLVSVAWTLRYEMAFYLLVGLAVGMPGFVRLSAVVRVLVLLAVLPLTMQTVPLIPGSLFVYGMLAREAYTALEKCELDLRWAAWIVAAAVVPVALYKFVPELRLDYPQMPVWLAQSNHRLRYVLTGVTLGGFVLLAARGGNAISRFAAFKPVRAFGLISYSYYLSHGLVVHFTDIALRPLSSLGYRSATLALVVFAVSFVATVVVAGALFLAVEFPASLRKRILY